MTKFVRRSGPGLLFVGYLLVSAGLSGVAAAADGKFPDFSFGDTPTPPSNPSQWNVACASEGRAEPLNCAIEQVALVAQTRQRFGAISVHTTSTNSAVTLQVLTPLGLLIPAGVSIQPDDGKPVALTIQSCDNSGCHAETTVGPDLLKALQNGKRLTLSLQSLSHKTMSVDFDLKGFTAAYAKIK